MEQDRVQNLRDYFRIGLTYSSNAIKGNTLTESETKVVLENGTPISGKLLKDHLDAIGHAKAFDYLWTLSRTSDKTEQDIKKLHELCFQPRTGDQAGSFLATNVLITGSAHNDEPPVREEIPRVMNRFVTELPGKKQSLHPAEYSAEIHRKLVMIHPYTERYYVSKNARAGKTTSKKTVVVTTKAAMATFTLRLWNFAVMTALMAVGVADKIRIVSMTVWSWMSTFAKNNAIAGFTINLIGSRSNIFR